uniref:Uncharacterized protein n=1 Tax=viral metagenome TaxID=1070528 RepID=A0A6C0KJP5_9ZZZZ
MSKIEKGPITFFLEKSCFLILQRFAVKCVFWDKCCLHKFFYCFYLRQSLGDFLLIYTKGKRDKC